MNHYPSIHERDWRGVCYRCGNMAETTIVCIYNRHSLENILRNELIQRYYNTPMDNIHDYREVTECCLSEDFIPFLYAVKCLRCGKWNDIRQIMDGGLCEGCHKKEKICNVDLSPLSEVKLQGN